MMQLLKRLFRKQEKREERGPWQEQCDGLVFECREVYLGKEADCCPGDERYTFYIHCSARDGLAWQFKCFQPYAIRCSFSGVGYYANDPMGFDYSDVLSQLLELQEDWRKMDQDDVFRELQEITARFVSVYFADQNDTV